MIPSQTKDYFSAQSSAYAAFRPTYPEDLFAFIFQHLRGKKCAWDCATGNGQVAVRLADHFEKVFATDISENQLKHAIPVKNIVYVKHAAEHTPFPDHHFDLITVGQALHWFDRDAFIQEAIRVGKPGGLLAVWGYAQLDIDPVINPLIQVFYEKTVGPYWDDARKWVEDGYSSFVIPLPQIPSPAFTIQTSWTIEQLAGYFFSWSATQKYIATNGSNPVPELIQSIAPHWDQTHKPVRFPVFLRLFRI